MYFIDDEDFTLCKSLKRRCSLNSLLYSEKSDSLLEDLPQDILIKILCGVEHYDLKQLLLVSKSVKEAALVAKQMYFAFCTPRKTLKFPNAEDISNSNDIQTPNAPKRSRPRLSPYKLSSIKVALFALDEDENNGDLPSAMEIEEY